MHDIFERLPSLAYFARHLYLVDDRATFTRQALRRNKRGLYEPYEQGTHWPKRGITVHYHGDPRNARTPKDQYLTCLEALRIHRDLDRFMPGYVNGAQYAFLVLSDRLVIAQNPWNILYNAGNWDINVSHIGFYFPIGKGQKPVGQMWKIAYSAMECIANDLGFNVRHAVLGHQEACNGCSECPGLLMNNIRALRVELDRNPDYRALVRA